MVVIIPAKQGFGLRRWAGQQVSAPHWKSHLVDEAGYNYLGNMKLSLDTMGVLKIVLFIFEAVLLTDCARVGITSDQCGATNPSRLRPLGLVCTRKKHREGLFECVMWLRPSLGQGVGCEIVGIPGYCRQGPPNPLHSPMQPSSPYEQGSWGREKAVKFNEI
ncbi:hypothetical protein INR49_030787 [Caranx melampygus]|nr:hypothetical protein INR49_030787 [Caranx melampygus]